MDSGSSLSFRREPGEEKGEEEQIDTADGNRGDDGSGSSGTDSEVGAVRSESNRVDSSCENGEEKKKEDRERVGSGYFDWLGRREQSQGDGGSLANNNNNDDGNNRDSERERMGSDYFDWLGSLLPRTTDVEAVDTPEQLQERIRAEREEERKRDLEEEEEGEGEASSKDDQDDSSATAANQVSIDVVDKTKNDGKEDECESNHMDPSNEVEEEKLCRICFDDEPIHDLIAPCLCSGSAGHVHRTCLNQWREKASTSEAMWKCQTCAFEYILDQKPNNVLPYGLICYDVFTFVAMIVCSFAAFFYLAKDDPLIYNWVVMSLGIVLLHPRARKWLDEHGIFTLVGCYVWAGVFAGALFFISLSTAHPFYHALAFSARFFFEWNGAHGLISFLLYALRRGREKLKSVNLPEIVCLERHPERRPSGASSSSSSSSSSSPSPSSSSSSSSSNFSVAGLASPSPASSSSSSSSSAQTNTFTNTTANDYEREIAMETSFRDSLSSSTYGFSSREKNSVELV